MIKIIKRELYIGEYKVILHNRYFKNFKKPLPYAWLLPDEPLLVISKNKEIVLVVNVKLLYCEDEEKIQNFLESVKNVKEIENFNNKLKENNIKIDLNHYVFDKENKTYALSKEEVFRVDLEKIEDLYKGKIDYYYYKKRGLYLASMKELYKNEFVFIRDMKNSVFTKNKYVYLINEEEEGESYEDVSSVLSDGSEDSHLNLRGSGCLSLLQYDFDVDKRTFFTLTNKTKIDFETGILHVYVGGMEEFCSLKKLVEKKIFFAVDL